MISVIPGGTKKLAGTEGCKNLLTPAMIYNIAHTTHWAHHDSDIAAIFDWLVLGLSTGVRRVKYAQISRTKIEMVWVQLDRGKPPLEQPYLFIDGDFIFLDKNCSPLKGGACKSNICAYLLANAKEQVNAKRSCSR